MRSGLTAATRRRASCILWRMLHGDLMGQSRLTLWMFTPARLHKPMVRPSKEGSATWMSTPPAARHFACPAAHAAPSDVLLMWRTRIGIQISANSWWRREDDEDTGRDGDEVRVRQIPEF